MHHRCLGMNSPKLSRLCLGLMLGCALGARAMTFDAAPPNLYLGGVERQFADKGNGATVLGYHGSYNKVTKEVNRNKSGDYFLEMTGGKMSGELIERFIRLEKKAGMLRFYHPDQRAKPGEPLALLCTGDEDRARRDEQCVRLAEVDALKQGVVTTWVLREIPRPPKPVKDKVAVKRWND